MNNKPLSLVLIVLLVSAAAAQSVYYPRNYMDAVKNGTRSLTGTPGPDYWQNSSDYKIRAEFDPATRLLSGELWLDYKNNSPDSLRIVVLKLKQDIYRKGNTRDFEISPVAVHDGVEIKKLSVNGTAIDKGRGKSSYRRAGTNLIALLPETLPAGGSINIEAEWSFTVPKESGIRMGSYKDSSYFISYWFPQMAVYDDIDGWDMIDYKGHTETYNDFSDYDVEITVPDDFIVWGTGLLQNADEVLESKFVDRMKTASVSDTVIRIIAKEDYESGGITKRNGKNRWKFKAEHVPDFAFGTSNSYYWDMTSLKPDKSDDRIAIVSAAYNPESKDFYEVAQIAQKSIEFLSKEMPGVPYPYPSMTVFNGSGGMEYPMIINDGSTQNRSRAAGLTSHEITHTYFPFYMGINERKYAWMDEGWAVMLPFEYQIREGGSPIENNISGYEEFAGSEEDTPPIIPSYLVTGKSYRNASYSRPGVAYRLLHDMMGEEKFKDCLHFYMKSWNGKHPVPYDFFFSFEKVYGEDLGWFWKPWFLEQGYPDLGIKSSEYIDGKYNVEIEKIGNVPVPVKLTAVAADGSEKVILLPVSVWANGNSIYKLTIDPGFKIVKLILGSGQIPDSFDKNNILEM